VCRPSVSIVDAYVYLQRAVASKNYGDRELGVGVVFLHAIGLRGESPSGTNSTRVLGWRLSSDGVKKERVLKIFCKG
jgi:hypothetical protein